jgi:hypothetical protein
MAAAPRADMVDFDAEAVRDFVGVKGKEERKALLNAIDKLRQLGPKLVRRTRSRSKATRIRGTPTSSSATRRSGPSGYGLLRRVSSRRCSSSPALITA